MAEKPTKGLTSSERAAYQAMRARGVSHEDALEDALDGVEADTVRCTLSARGAEDTAPGLREAVEALADEWGQLVIRAGNWYSPREGGMTDAYIAITRRLRALLDRFPATPPEPAPEATVVEEWGVRDVATGHSTRTFTRSLAYELLEWLARSRPGKPPVLVRRTRTTYRDHVTEWEAVDE